MPSTDSYHLRCASCSAVNRVPQGKVGASPKCAKCAAHLSANEAVPITVTDASWESEVKSSTLPTVVEVWGDNCGVCTTYAAKVDEMARHFYGKARVLKLDAGRNPRTASLYQIRGVPTLLIFKGGKFDRALVGAQPEEVVRGALGV